MSGAITGYRRARVVTARDAPGHPVEPTSRWSCFRPRTAEEPHPGRWSLVAGGGGGGGWVTAGAFVNEALVGGAGGAVGGANPFDAWTEPVGGGGATAEGGGRGTMVAANGERGTGDDGAVFGGSGGGGGLYGEARAAGYR